MEQEIDWLYGDIHEEDLMKLKRRDAMRMVSFLIGFFRFKEKDFDFRE